MIFLHPDRENLTTGRNYVYTRGFYLLATDDLHVVAERITQQAWTPAQYLNGYRKSVNFQVAFVVALDFDDGKLSLSGAVDRFRDYIHIIGPTRSHLVEKHGLTCDRFRVILMLESGIADIRVYKSTMKALVRAHPESDQKPKDAGRFFYPCREITSFSSTGKRVPMVRKGPKPRKPRSYELERQHKYVPLWIRGFLRYGLPRGQRNDTCLRIAKTLHKCGFSEPEIERLISASAIDLPSDELPRCIANGVAYALREASGG